MKYPKNASEFVDYNNAKTEGKEKVSDTIIDQ
jgi:hypothetical protein